MLKELLAYVVPLLLWGALTGIINLAFGYKSQIEAWAESRPRVAALLKLSRAIGLDPWNILSALKLAASKRLPDAQKSDSPIAQLEQRKADAKRLGVDEPPKSRMVPPLMLLTLCLVLLLGCDPRKPPCDESKLRAADRRYTERVAATCLAKYDSFAECPEGPALKAQHRSELREVCP